MKWCAKTIAHHFLESFPKLPIWTHLPDMSKTLSNLRKITTRRAGLPVLTVTDIARRWRLHADTARAVLRDHELPKAQGPWRHPRYAFVDILRIEGVHGAPLQDPDDHLELAEPLMTAAELAELFDCVPATIRNYAAQDFIPSIRLGGSIRFRRSDVLGSRNED